MAEECTDEWSIPVARYPAPVCTVSVDDGTAVVRGVNGPFESAFGDVETGVPVVEAFDSLGLTSRDEGPFERHLVAGEQFTLRTETAEYQVETVSPKDGNDGHLVFTERPGRDEFGVDNVASVVSHDLRNPLDVAKSRLRAGREFDEDEHFDHVAQAHERMERIIQDVLTLARGEDVVDPDGTVELDTIARDAWETVDTGDGTLDVVGPLPTTVADSDRVSRLFENLFRNAVEHGSKGQLSVTVGPLDETSAEGFYVADDGVGIPPAERDRVFDPGYSSDDHGTGLGLAIVARIADLHGWSCTVTDSTDGGARIEVRGLDAETDS